MYRRLGERWPRLGRSLGVLSGGGVPWYRAGGAPAPWGAWKFKGAASEAASLLDLVNSNNWTKTGSPTWDANGWAGNDSGYLQIDHNTVCGSTTAIFRFAGIDDAVEGLFGHYDGANYFLLRASGTGNMQALEGGTGEYVATYSAAAVWAIANGRLYKNGVAVGTGWAAGSGTISAQNFYLMAYNNNGSPVAPIDVGDYCLGGAIYDAALTPAQILAISTALAAL